MATAQQGIMALPEMSQQAQTAAISPEQMAAFDQIRQSVSPKEFSDELLSSASQADPQAVAEFKQALEEMDVPAEILDLINQLVDEVLANPENYEAIKQKYLAQGVTDDILPEQFDPEFFAALNVAVDQLRGEPAGPQAFAKGGIAELKPIAQALASYGRNGDTMLAHITPAEARMLKKRGGSGTVNPVTGLPEFFLKKLFSKIGSAVKKFTRSTVGRIVTTVALGFFLGPAAASMLGVGAGTAAGAAISGFVGSAGSTLLAGGNVRDALKAGAVAGITAGTGAALFGDMPLIGPAEMTAKEAFQTQVGKVANFFDTPAKVYTEAAGPSLPSPPAQPELPTMPGSQAPVAARVPDKYDLLPDSFGEARAIERAATTGVPSVGTVAPPVTAPASTALSGGTAAQQAVTAQSAVPTVGQSIKTIGEGLGLGQGPASWETFKQGVSDLFLPQGASQEAIDLKVNELMAKNPRMPYADALKRVTSNMTPGIMRSYGPMAAAGLGIMGLTGGFKQREVESPYSGLFTGGAGSAADLMKKDPYRYYIQGLPGVQYVNGMPVFGPPPGYQEGGEVLPSAEQIGAQAALQTPMLTSMGPAPTSPVPVSGIGTLAAPTQVATPQFGGFGGYSPAAMATYYQELNRQILAGGQPRVPADFTGPGTRPTQQPLPGPSQAQIDAINQANNRGSYITYPTQPTPPITTMPIETPVGPTRPTMPPRNPAVTPPVTTTPPTTPPTTPKFDYKAYMYALDPNDHTLATERGLAYALSQNWSPERTVSEWNSALGTNFTVDDYYRATGIPRPGSETIDPVTGVGYVTPVAPPEVAPFDFKSYMYAMDPADHTLATERGLAYAKSQGWSPQRTVDEWNSALGTRFTLDDYYRATGTVPPVAPPTIPAPGSGIRRDMDEYVVEKRYGGIASLARGGYPRRTGQIDGPGTETSDSIPAMLSDGEFVMTAKAVRGAGNGDRRSGAKKMYALMHQLERNASRG